MVFFGIRHDQIAEIKRRSVCRDIPPKEDVPRPAGQTWQSHTIERDLQTFGPLPTMGMGDHKIATSLFERVSRSSKSPISTSSVATRARTGDAVVVTATATLAPISCNMLLTSNSRSGSAPIASCGRRCENGHRASHQRVDPSAAGISSEPGGR